MLLRLVWILNTNVIYIIISTLPKIITGITIITVITIITIVETTWNILSHLISSTFQFLFTWSRTKDKHFDSRFFCCIMAFFPMPWILVNITLSICTICIIQIEYTMNFKKRMENIMSVKRQIKTPNIYNCYWAK